MKRRQKGKRKFISFFTVRLGILTAAAAAAGVIQTCQNMQNRAEKVDEFGPDYAIEEFSWGLDEIQPEEISTQIPRKLAYISNLWGFNQDKSMEAYWMLYQPNTGEYYLSEPNVMVVAAGEAYDDVIKRYIDDPEIAETLAAHYDRYLDIAPRIQSIYVKGDETKLGEVYLPEPSLFRSIFKDPVPNDYVIRGEWADCSPENTDGWEKITALYAKEDQEIYSSESSIAEPDLYVSDWTFIYGSYNAVHLKPLMDQMLRLLENAQKESTERIRETEEAYQEALNAPFTPLHKFGEWYETKEEYLEGLKKKIKSSRSRLKYVPLHAMDELFYQEDPEGKYYSLFGYPEGITLCGEEWYLYQYQYFDPDVIPDDMLIYIINFGLMAFLGVIAAASVWSIIRYLVYSKRYDIEVYRRNLTGALAHDLKTPLTAISGYAENLRDHTHPEKDNVYTDAILQNVQHMDEIVVGALGLSRLEHSSRPEKKPVNLTEMMQEAFLHDRDMMQNRGLKLKISGECTVKGNADMLRQLCHNLAANAVQHARENSEITVSADQKHLIIQNLFDGEIDEKTVCEPFRRGDEARGRRSGSGLGLSIVRQIAALHKWKLKVTARDGIFTVKLHF